MAARKPIVSRLASRTCPSCGEQFKVGTHHKCPAKPAAAVSLRDLVSGIPSRTPDPDPFAMKSASTNAPSQARITRDGFYDRFVRHMKITRDQFALLKYSLKECGCGADNCVGWVAARPIDKNRSSVWGMTMVGQVREAATWVGDMDSSNICMGNVNDETSTSTMEALDRAFASMEDAERSFWEKRMQELEAIPPPTSKPLGAVEAFYSHIGSERTRSIGQGRTTLMDELAVKTTVRRSK